MYVTIEFFDHTLEKGNKQSDTFDIVKCKATGKVIAFDRDKVTIQTWESMYDDSENYVDNQEVINIIASTIVSIMIFKPTKVLKFY